LGKSQYGAYDQANVDRFARGGIYRFRYVPAWYAPWVERRGDEWYSEGAEAAVREAFYDSLSEFQQGERADSEEIAVRSQGVSQKSQEAALWLLQRDSRFWSSPEEFEIPGGRLLRPEIPPWDEGTESAFHKLTMERFSGGETERVSKWVLTARHKDSYASRARVEKNSLLLARIGSWVGDLLALDPLLSELFGSRVVRVGAKTWTQFPESLGPALARELAGAAVVVLQGPEDMRYFSEVALVRWLLSESETWHGADGCTYRLPMPRCLMLTGRPLPTLLPYLAGEVGDRIVLVGGER
jgi:hypothetical protein